MIQRILTIAILAVATTFAQAQPSLPASFQSKTIHSPEGADIFVRWGGTGPVALLLHGYAENSDSWAPLAADLMKDHNGRRARPSRYRQVLQARGWLRQEN